MDILQLKDMATIGAPIVALLAAFIAAGSFGTARRSLLHSRATLVTQVRAEWVKLQAEWAIVRTLKSGPQDYYSEATPAQRASVRDMANEMSAVFAQGGYRADFHAPLQVYKNQVTRVVEFLDMCARLLLSGRLKVDDVYAVLGPDVTRQGATIRWIIGIGISTWWEDDVPENLKGADGYDWLGQIVDMTSYARQQRILALVDLLWAEACRCGDREAHIMMQIAAHKQEKSGAVCRRRVRRLTKQLHNRKSSWRLQWHLLFAEYLPVSAVHQGGKRVCTQIEMKTLRMGFWRLRATISWVRSYIAVPDRVTLRVRHYRKRQDPLAH